MELPSHRLDPRMLTVWYRSSFVLIAGTLVCTGVAVGLALHFAWPLVIVLGIAAVILIIELIDLAISPRVEYATWRYDVTPTEVDLYHGVFVKKRIIVPLIRVQHVETKQGPLLKASGLAAVRILLPQVRASRSPAWPKTRRMHFATGWPNLPRLAKGDL